MSSLAKIYRTNVALIDKKFVENASVVLKKSRRTNKTFDGVNNSFKVIYIIKLEEQFSEDGLEQERRELAVIRWPWLSGLLAAAPTKVFRTPT